MLAQQKVGSVCKGTSCVLMNPWCSPRQLPQPGFLTQEHHQTDKLSNQADVAMHVFACVSQVHLSRSEAWFAMIQVALDLGYDLSIWKGHEGVGMVEVCCNHRAWFCLVLILHDARLQ